uniref:No apical meristem-associated C-terminal domain-containing protein n=1 Tax=Brassica oleracea var. oleracea TaxID=109376 RepID=A0A0D3CIS9_BRAOL
MMQYFSQRPPLSSTLTGDAHVPRATEFPEFSTQIALGGISGASEPIPDANADESAQARRRILSGPPIKTWCYLVDGLNMEQKTLLAGTRKAKHTEAKFLSTNDVMAKAHELYSSGKNEYFNLMSEWLAVRDQPRNGSQVGGNTGSTSSGSKRSRESDASDSNSVGSNSVGSSAHPMGREAAKKKQKEKQSRNFGNRQRRVE